MNKNISEILSQRDPISKNNLGKVVCIYKPSYKVGGLWSEASPGKHYVNLFEK
jgi:hypothetical protein